MNVVVPGQLSSNEGTTTSTVIAAELPSFVNRVSTLRTMHVCSSIDKKLLFIISSDEPTT